MKTARSIFVPENKKNGEAGAGLALVTVCQWSSQRAKSIDALLRSRESVPDGGNTGTLGVAAYSTC